MDLQEGVGTLWKQKTTFLPHNLIIISSPFPSLFAGSTSVYGGKRVYGETGISDRQETQHAQSMRYIIGAASLT